MEPYERFKAWQLAHALFLDVRLTVKKWPSEERFELSSQTRRAAWSVPANIVEGSARRGRREFRHGLDIAYGSLAELGYALRTARELGYITPEEHRQLETKRTEASKTLWGLLNSVRDA
jgi:four helix bundle protein